jgi:hypothetical protein
MMTVRAALLVLTAFQTCTHTLLVLRSRLSPYHRHLQWEVKLSERAREQALLEIDNGISCHDKHVLTE